MKKFLLTLCVVSLPLHAAVDFTQNDKRDIYDLMYLPEGGTFFGQTSLSADASYSEISLNGNKFSKNKNTGTSADQVIGYSITDRISLSANLDYSFKSSSKTELQSGSDSTSDSKGVGDPAIGAKFRLMDQRTDSFNLDLVPTYTFSSGPSKSDGNSSDNKSGGTSYGVSLQGGKKFSDLQVMVGVGWDHSNVSTSKDTATGTSSRSPQSNSFDANIAVQKFLKEKFYFGVSGGFIFLSAQKDSNSGTTTKTPVRVMSAIAGNLGYLLMPNMTVEGNVGFVSIADYKVKDSSGNNYSVEKAGGGVLSVALKYQF